MRGEHKDDLVPVVLEWGSSPHARGALLLVNDGHADTGIIPACAGSTRRQGRTAARIRDHPRMRGEHIGLGDTVRRDSGSSPHARGALTRLHLHALQRGIIPACAGSTSDGLTPTRALRDHPRMRGEHTN